MAEEIATGYLQIMPSAKGMKAALEKELKGSVAGPVASESKAAADALSKNLAGAVERDAAPRVQAALTQATGKASMGFLQQMKVAVAHFGGGAAVLQGLAQQGERAATQVRGLVQGSSALATASGGMKAGLLGVSSLLGGPWGIAIGGAGLALTYFAQKQQEAEDAAKSLADTIDKQTGKFTAASAKDIATRVSGKLDKPGDLALLAKMGVDVASSTSAVLQGGKALDDYIAKLRTLSDQQRNQVGASSAEVQSVVDRRNALGGLISALEAERTASASATNQSQIDRAAQSAAAQAAAALGFATDTAARGIKGLSEAQVGAATTLGTYAAGLRSISAQAADVMARIKAIPANVTIDAKAVGLDKIKAQADAATAALLGMIGALQAGNSVSVDGERHGADVAQNKTTQTVSKLLAGYDADYRRALAALNAHNARVTSGGSASRSGGGRGGSASNPLAAARQALIAQVTDTSFITNLLSADAKSVGKLGASLVKGATAVLTRGRETALTALIRKDTAALQKLATRRAAVAKSLADAQSSLASLQSAKASTSTSLTQSALGDLTGARSASGVQRVLTRQLQKVTTFRANLATLAKRGLPGVFLQQLVNAGLDGAYTAAALVRANDNDFAAIQSLTTQLNTQATGLGTDAGAVLYDSGIAAAQGLIKGLQSQEAAVEAQMLRIAKAMQAAIKKALGIRSPSQVFAELGRQIPRGLDVGIRKEAPGLNRTVGTMVSTRIPQRRLGGASAVADGGVQMEVHQYGMDPATAATEISNALVWRNRR